MPESTKEGAMPPAPKDPARRQRRNKVAGAGILTLVPAGSKAKVPSLPEQANGTDWHIATQAWWDDIWHSPMAAEFDRSDIHGLLVLAVLVDGFWKSPSKEMAAEIRLQRQCFGLTPIDRRRLQWEIDRGEQATAKTAQRKAATTPRAVTPRKDPRKALA